MDLKDSLAIKMGVFSTYYKEFWSKWDTFQGRVSRIDYWRIRLVHLLVSPMIFLVSLIPILGQFLDIFFMIAGITLEVRRGHDIGESGWMIVFEIIAFVGCIFCGFLMFGLGPSSDAFLPATASFFGLGLFGIIHPLYRWFARGHKGENQYGSDPLEDAENNDKTKIIERVVYVQEQPTQKQKAKTPKAKKTKAKKENKVKAF